AGSVRLVVFGVPDLAFVAAQGPSDVTVHEELLFHPQRAGHAERGKAFWGDAEVRFEDTLELEEGLVVERHVRKVAGANARATEAIGDGASGERGVPFLATEA